MNEISEMWSLPWHELQRSLANGAAAQTSPLIASVVVARHAQNFTAAPPSWLARARAQVQQSAGRGL